MSLSRHYGNVVVDRWIDDNHFVGTVDRNYPNRVPEHYACYGWTKGGKFIIYKIDEGQIQRLGTVSGIEIHSR